MKTLQNILIVISCAFSTFVQAQADEDKPFKELNTPNFLIQNQLSPEIFRIEYSGGIVKGAFENTEGVEQNKFNRSTFAVSGYPVGLIQKKYQQLYLGFGYAQDRFTSFNSDVNRSLFDDTRETINSTLSQLSN